MAIHGYSDAGKARLKAYSFLYAVNIVVLALAARVNQFQDFFFMADLFPLGLSITTLILLTGILLLDFTVYNPITARPPFEIGFLTVLTIFWLAFNAFSTSRWRYVPLACGNIPDQYADERSWCRDLQALKAFVWIEWVTILITASLILRYVVREHNAGNKHIWRTALSRYYPYTGNRLGDTNENMSRDAFHERSSSFFVTERSFRL